VDAVRSRADCITLVCLPGSNPGNFAALRENIMRNLGMGNKAHAKGEDAKGESSSCRWPALSSFS
jgi:hypothetical protein